MHSRFYLLAVIIYLSLPGALAAWVVRCNGDPRPTPVPRNCYGEIVSGNNILCDQNGEYHAPLEGPRTGRRDPACRYCECEYAM
jgi:hypothetical protein